jgi:hypothetical protein
MSREDISGRFDYLFEPLDVVEPAGDDDDAEPQALAQPDNQNRWSNRIVLAGAVLATMAAATATAIALLQPAQPAQQTVIPTDATPMFSTASTAVDTVIPTTIAVSTSANQRPEATPTIEQQRPPVQQPTTSASKPAGTTAPPPNHARAQQCRPRVTPTVSEPDPASKQQSTGRAARGTSVADGLRHAGSQEPHSITDTPTGRAR